jgi:hypothetical protein
MTSVASNWSLNKYSLSGSDVTSASNITDWDAYAVYKTGLTNNFTASVTINQTNLQSMFGFSTSQTPSVPVYNSMPFCLYTIANGSLAIFENGGSTFIIT